MLGKCRARGRAVADQPRNNEGPGRASTGPKGLAETAARGREGVTRDLFQGPWRGREEVCAKPLDMQHVQGNDITDDIVYKPFLLPCWRRYLIGSSSNILVFPCCRCPVPEPYCFADFNHRCAKASLLLTGDGTQGIGFRHEPDWDVYKNDDWGRRREVLRRLVNAVGTWIARRRAGRRLAAIQVRTAKNRRHEWPRER